MNGLTNRSLGNFSEYQFKGNYNSFCNFPNSDFVRTSPNPNIHQNFPFALQSRVQSSHNHSQQGLDKEAGSNRILSSNNSSMNIDNPADNSIKMLPLTEVKENC